jgi:hypothetical protein
MRGWKGALLAAAFAMFATPASAAIIYVDLGTGAPPATLGGYTMTAFGPDGRPLFTDVTDVTAPGGGTVDFSGAVNLRQIGNGWATWSHGYTGDVYYSNGATDLTLTLPSGTGAFYLYVEPEPFALIDFEVCSFTTCSGFVGIDGSAGARGFGFYGTGGDTITSISILGRSDFAVGEFGIAQSVPEPATLLLLGVGAVGFIARRRMI